MSCVRAPAAPANALILCGLVFALLPSAAKAQVLYGSIVGNVKDPSGAAVVGASVTITQKQTDQSRQTATNESGGYDFSTVPSGSYTVLVTAPGFSTFTEEQVLVTINNVTRVDITLKVGAVAETVQVTADTAALQTDRPDVRAEITTDALENVPMPVDRNYQSLFVTIPGFSPPDQAHSTPSNPSRAMTFNVNGVSRSSNNTRIDGASGTNVWLPHMTSYIPAAEAIESVNVVTNSFDAEIGLAGGAAINVQIKSGANTPHGSAFLYHNDASANAKSWITPPGQRNPKRIANQFGATLGGPIKKNKLFFFVSFEGTRDRLHDAQLATIPTMAIRSGDMSESSRPIYDPLTGNPDGSEREPFPDKIIPQSRIDPTARKIAALFPQPTFPSLTNNYYANAPFRFDRNTVDTKINWTASPKLSMYARVSKLGFSTYNRQFFGDALGGPPIHGGGNPGNGFGYTWSTTLAATYVATTRLVLDTYFGWTLMDTNSEQPLLDRKIGLNELGIPGTNGPRRFEGGWPRFSITNYTTFGINEDYMPYYRHDPQYQYVINASWTRGNHNLRFGGEMYRQMLNHTQPEFSAGSVSNGAQGGFTFAGGPTQVRGGPASNQFNTFATFLLGMYTGGGKILLVPDVYTTRTWLHSYYLRDRWNLTPRLTLSYGLRYEYFPLPTRADRGMERYDFQNNKMLVCGYGVVPQDCGVQIGRKYFAPRGGFAWRATDRFVIRAGYGITNDPYNLARSLRTNYPILLAMIVPAPITLQPAGTLREGLPPMTPPDLGNGIIDVPGNIAVNSLGEKFKRGYIQSWNLTLERQLG
ncbi:MAG: TonB-dependent receptor, partial [Acidobacteria bacterium]|nr:TonB-dependent receptor [Acidobacteriota bacterium]